MAQLDTLQGQIQLNLGQVTVEKWMDKITNPTSLSQKLGIDHSHKIALFGVYPLKLSARLKKIPGFCNLPKTRAARISQKCQFLT